jgi:hypothetical protein
LYQSPFFQLAKQFAEGLSPAHRFILSAEHGLVDARQELSPYTMTMSALGQSGTKAWGKSIADDLGGRLDLSQYEVVVLGLGRFADPIVKHLPQASAPLARMTLQEAMAYLSNQSDGPRRRGAF